MALISLIRTSCVAKIFHLTKLDADYSNVIQLQDIRVLTKNFHNNGTGISSSRSVHAWKFGFTGKQCSLLISVMKPIVRSKYGVKLQSCRFATPRCCSRSLQRSNNVLFLANLVSHHSFLEIPNVEWRQKTSSE